MQKTATMNAGLLATLALLTVSVQAVCSSAIAGAFDGLNGSWGGGGTVTFDAGSKERLRCNAYYKTQGENFNMVIRCASTGTKVELRGNLAHSGGKVSGTWEERTYNATGNVSGTIKPGSLKVSISGPIQGTMSVSTSGSTQNVYISSRGTALRTISLGFSRK